MKNKALLLLSIILFGMTAITAVGATFDKNLSQAVQTLKIKKGDRNLLLLTDAPYVKLDGRNALSYLDAAQEKTGCTVGKGNLLFFQRSQSHPLRFLLMRKSDGSAVVISREGNNWVSEKINLGSAVISTPAFWEQAKAFKAGEDMFTLAAIAAVWAHGGPYDFLKSAELHNHICPGLTSGYLIAHYIQNHFLLNEGEKYTVVSSPAWCKEDALEVILDCTPGKHGMVVKHLSKAQIEKITFANPAGMVLVWNAKAKTGKGYALTFDFDKLKALSVKDSPKAATVLAALDHLGDTDRFVATAAEFTLTETLYNDITQAGSNPYQLAGLLKK